MEQDDLTVRRGPPLKIHPQVRARWNEFCRITHKKNELAMALQSDPTAINPDLASHYTVLYDVDWTAQSATGIVYGQGDLVLCNDSQTSFAVIQIQFIDRDQCGSTAQTARTKKRKKVKEQAVRYRDLFREMHRAIAKEEVKAAAYTNERFEWCVAGLSEWSPYITGKNSSPPPPIACQINNGILKKDEMKKEMKKEKKEIKKEEEEEEEEEEEGEEEKEFKEEGILYGTTTGSVKMEEEDRRSLPKLEIPPLRIRPAILQKWHTFCRNPHPKVTLAIRLQNNPAQVNPDLASHFTTVYDVDWTAYAAGGLAVGDLILCNDSQTHFAVIQIQWIDTEASGSTAQTARTHKRKKSKEQALKYQEHFRAMQPNTTEIRAASYTNERFEWWVEDKKEWSSELEGEQEEVSLEVLSRGLGARNMQGTMEVRPKIRNKWQAFCTTQHKEAYLAMKLQSFPAAINAQLASKYRWVYDVEWSAQQSEGGGGVGDVIVADESGTKFAVIEIKWIDNEAHGRTAKTSRTHKRKKVKEQALRYREYFEKMHYWDAKEVRAAIYTNEVFEWWDAKTGWSSQQQPKIGFAT